jgi:hypothetical protein
MTEHDPGWQEYVEYSDYDEAMHNEHIIEMFRAMMEYANENRDKAFVICSTVIERDGDKALYSPEYEGELLAVEESDEEDYLVLKDVVVMHEEDDPDPKAVLKYTTLEQHETLRIPISKIGNVMGGNRRLGNDYAV